MADRLLFDSLLHCTANEGFRLQTVDGTIPKRPPIIDIIIVFESQVDVGLWPALDR